MYIMIAGPYTSGSKNREKWKQNHKKMNKVAYEVHLKGHIPVIGVNVALPIIETVGFDKFEELMMPISLAMAHKCDAVLRIGGASIGADQEVEIFKGKGLPVYYNIDQISLEKV
ncbi:hypothetical protein ULMA_00120 [Patiriisocius marinus]|uniref:DUF4406 domain-containing protein n=1 Tax=Patiriisocius marinus TaxID=1397112 RepID=A0A5J4ITD5_9FLAO|nr:DUF4406 domain-containing protein [Patiriisocius marinus]GER57904.1 hypothetical protein ULMA_00120 [Patiriisocius marinus]